MEAADLLLGTTQLNGGGDGNGKKENGGRRKTD
jgi:hypothetical protein